VFAEQYYSTPRN